MHQQENRNSSENSIRKVCIQTWGCQMNKYDSEKMAGMLRKYNYSLTPDLNSADVVLLNTCSIREKAEQKVFSKLGRIKKYKVKNPNLVIGVGGCVGQISSKAILKRAPYVDLVFGTLNIHRLPSLLETASKGNAAVSEIFSEAEQYLEDYPISRKSGIQAWVSIMHGCNNYCSYCVVPYTRGREISRKCNDILNEIKVLSQHGYKEVTLLGQNVNSYGKGTEEGITFPGLLEKINEIPGIERIRFVTSHPKDFSKELIRVIKNFDKVCEQIHLPAQSGSNKILSLMNRKYSLKDYMEKINTLKSSISGVALSTDIIVGFPGETKQDFQATIDLITKIEFDSIFLFNFSPRPETVAAKLPGQVNEKIKQKRFNTLLDLQKGITLKLNKRLEGKNVDILVEGKSKTNLDKLTGRTRTNKIVNFTVRAGTAAKLKLNTSADGDEIFQKEIGSEVSNAGKGYLTGKIVPVKIVRSGLYSLDGQVIN
ncbi:MAG TPA: tRNA (N6-isopentenyl adenosine(37)-C2)-methylthiotransferase MiaB [Nitrospinota bacterium]|nr:tRNA (N6-isopentenyl adenosine(37)-C2)-methylthiotransferase MiaB [Nitrospinota bacterium]